MSPSPIIEASGLTKTYRGATTAAVDHLGFAVSEGEIFGLLGPNGAGKSTTIKMLCGLLKIDGGSISVFGLDVARSGAQIRKKVGVAPQDIALFPSLTAYENLVYFSRMYGLHGAAIYTLARRRMDQVDLAEGSAVRAAPSWYAYELLPGGATLPLGDSTITPPLYS